MVAGFFHQNDFSGSFCRVFLYSVYGRKTGGGTSEHPASLYWEASKYSKESGRDAHIVWEGGKKKALSYLLIPCLNAEEPSGSNRLHNTQCCDDLFLDFEVHQ